MDTSSKKKTRTSSQRKGTPCKLKSTPQRRASSASTPSLDTPSSRKAMATPQAIAPTTSLTSNPPRHKPGFLDLQGEIRNQIYEASCPSHYIDIAYPKARAKSTLINLEKAHPQIASEVKGFQDEIFFMLNTRNISKDLEPFWANKVWNAWLDGMKPAEIARIRLLVFYTDHFVVKVHLLNPKEAELRMQRFDFELSQPRDKKLRQDMTTALTELATLKAEIREDIRRNELSELADAVLKFDEYNGSGFESVCRKTGGLKLVWEATANKWLQWQLEQVVGAVRSQTACGT